MTSDYLDLAPPAGPDADTRCDRVFGRMSDSRPHRRAAERIEMTEPVRIGNATLYLGDCMDILPTLPKVDAVITDPPYGSDATHAGHLSLVAPRQDLGFVGLSEEEMEHLARAFLDSARRWVVFTCEWKYMHAIPGLVRFGIWRKPDGAPQFTGDRPGTGWEAIAICHGPGKKRWNGGGKHAFYSYPKGQNNSGHPTGKPLGLFSEFVCDFTVAHETVLDPFMGSGTTGVACAQMGRHFIGIEKEPKYFDIACKRIEQAYAQGQLFEHEETPPVQEALEL